jgi:hypothetical protein
MKFQYRCIEGLPRLAWCATVRHGADTVEVRHGGWVEARDRWFCEGAWAGDFAAGDFAAAPLMGSGGTLVERGVLFAAPHHTLERLHSIQQRETTFVSNSLAFLLAAAGDDLDRDYPFYRRDLKSVIDGLKKCVTAIPTRAGNRVSLHYHCNITVDGHGTIREDSKPPAPDFKDFADYKGFLESTVKALHRNATHAERRIAYRPVATISTGYDSPACAVLARSVGCDEALTFRTGRELREADWRTTSDNGAEIGARLAMRVKEYDRMDYLRAGGAPEAEVLAYGPTTLDAVMLAWEKDLPRTMLFTGFHGDKVWDVDNHKVGPDIVRGDASGATLGEYRLRVGFIHVPAPFIGCTSHPAIDRISHAEEMKPWRLGNDYDRPIPRRIVEEAGVPRGLFGQKKKAATVPMFGTELRGRELSEAALADFKRYYREHRTLGNRILAATVMETYALYLKAARIANFVLRGFKAKARLPYRAPVPLPPAVRYNKRFLPDARGALLNQWGIEKIKTRYAAASGQASPR